MSTVTASLIFFSQKKLAQLPAVDMQHAPAKLPSKLHLFACVDFMAQSLCSLHSDCASKLVELVFFVMGVLFGFVSMGVCRQGQVKPSFVPHFLFLKTHHNVLPRKVEECSGGPHVRFHANICKPVLMRIKQNVSPQPVAWKHWVEERLQLSAQYEPNKRQWSDTTFTTTQKKTTCFWIPVIQQVEQLFLKGYINSNFEIIYLRYIKRKIRGLAEIMIFLRLNSCLRRRSKLIRPFSWNFSSPIVVEFLYTLDGGSMVAQMLRFCRILAIMTNSFVTNDTPEKGVSCFIQMNPLKFSWNLLNKCQKLSPGDMIRYILVNIVAHLEFKDMLMHHSQIRSEKKRGAEAGTGTGERERARRGKTEADRSTSSAGRKD
ncbi:hypothetical protein VP01_3g3 [Puccinia sorghi]|uniref:Uncharacterized protein n=1 Tax=Puccinia sorghi TaxID=27349 RepID=A0A0L6USV2_9BASI|nr:hypothetical protein VP01_3g3 [Puccinia sorghi]